MKLIDDIRHHLATLNSGQQQREGAVLLREAATALGTFSPYLTDRERVAVLWAIATLQTEPTPDGGQDAEAAEILTDMLTRIASEPPPQSFVSSPAT